MTTIDRIEGRIAVIEQDGVSIDIPLSELPEGIHEGSILIKTEQGWALCPVEEQTRRASLAERRRRLLERKS